MGAVFTAQDLVESLARSSEDSYVRLVAHWMTGGEVTDVEPARTDFEVVDALVAAAVAHLAQTQGLAAPIWTNTRRLRSFWHPGRDAFFAHALLHAPQAFVNRGLLIEADSLESV